MRTRKARNTPLCTILVKGLVPKRRTCFVLYSSKYFTMRVTDFNDILNRNILKLSNINPDVLSSDNWLFI